MGIVDVEIGDIRCVSLALQDRGEIQNAMSVFLPTHSASLIDAKVYRTEFICMSAALVSLCSCLCPSVCMFVGMHAWVFIH